MSDDSSSSNATSTPKSWLERLQQMFGAEPKNRGDLQDVIDDASKRDLIDNDTREMISGVLDIADMRVRDIMIPRSQMVTLEVKQSIEQMLPVIIESAHSRFPVVDEDKDHVIGILLAKDLLQYGFNTEAAANFDLTPILRPVVVVPESKRLDKLLKEFRQERYHMAIVVDEYGGVSGLVTIEDILEQIVGDIDDEYDDEEDDLAIKRVSNSVWTLNALTPIEDFNEHFASNFSDDEVDTVGGLIAHAFGHVPTSGETISLDGFLFKVLSADARRIVRLQVRVPDNQENNE